MNKRTRELVKKLLLARLARGETNHYFCEFRGAPNGEGWNCRLTLSGRLVVS